jgi:hypothetical protein
MPEGVLPVFDAIAAELAIAIVLVTFPRLAPPLGARAAAFDAFAERVRRADHARRPDAATSPPSPAFLVAAFHPAPSSARRTPSDRSKGQTGRPHPERVPRQSVAACHLARSKTWRGRRACHRDGGSAKMGRPTSSIL